MKLFNHVLEFSYSKNSNRKWNDINLYRNSSSQFRFGAVYSKTLYIGKFSILFGQPHLEPITVCAECFEPVQMKRAGDEYWIYCEGCQAVEQDTVELTMEEYEARVS